MLSIVHMHYCAIRGASSENAILVFTDASRVVVDNDAIVGVGLAFEEDSKFVDTGLMPSGESEKRDRYSVRSEIHI